MGRTKQFLPQRWVVVAMLGMAVVGGCTDGGASFIIIQNQVPSQGCVIPTQVGSDFRARGRIDVQASDGYLFTPVVESLAQESPNGNSPRVIQVQGADIDLSFVSGFLSSDEQADLSSSGLTRFSQAFSGSIFPGGTASFGFLIVPRGLLVRLADKLGDGEITQVTAEIVIFGELDGGDVEASPFRYPVDICNGCMLIDRGPCANLADDFEASEGGECNLLQDVPLECCDGDVCPAQPPSA